MESCCGLVRCCTVYTFTLPLHVGMRIVQVCTYNRLTNCTITFTCPSAGEPPLAVVTIALGSIGRYFPRYVSMYVRTYVHVRKCTCVCIFMLCRVTWHWVSSCLQRIHSVGRSGFHPVGQHLSWEEGEAEDQ